MDIGTKFAAATVATTVFNLIVTLKTTTEIPKPN